MKTIELYGVEFDFQRINCIRGGSRKPWQITVKKTGKVLEGIFTGKTIEQKIQSMHDTARIIGAERFKTEIEAA